MKTILIISPYFPPHRHVAVSRIEAYAKYLSKKYKVIVVTMGDTDRSQTFKFGNGNQCYVYYRKNPLIWRFLFYTGREGKLSHILKTGLRLAFDKMNISHFLGWSKKLESFLATFLNDNRVDILISSYAPEDVLEVSYLVLMKSKKTEIKWVIDFRDEYSDEEGLSPWIKNRRQQREMKYSSRADLVISVSEPHIELFRNRMLYAKDFLELRNGFDHNIQPKSVEKGDFLKVGYFGSFHGLAKPKLLFDAIEELKIQSQVQLFFAVKNVNFEIPKKMSGNVTILPYMSYEDSIKTMGTMDVNLLILPSKKRRGVYSGKIFDYISSQRPVLALVNHSDVAAQLLNQFGCGYIASPDNFDEIKDVLLLLYEDWSNQRLRLPREKDMHHLHRKHQIEKLINWIR